MTDYCYGTGTVHWLDDSYAQGSYACRGCSAPTCPAKKEVPVPRTNNPSDPTPTHTIVVRVPVTIEDEGQFGRQEKHTSNYEVAFDGSVVCLTRGVETISFPWAGIEAAIGVLGS